MKRYERIIAILVLIQFIPFSVYAQLGSSSTMKKIDRIENNTASDITIKPDSNVIIDSTSHIQVPIGSTAQRDPAPVNGVIRYNSDNDEFEGFIAGLWDAIGGGIDLTQKGNLIGYSTETQECVLTKTDGYLLTVDATATCGFDFKEAPVSTTLDTLGQLQTHDGVSNASFNVGADDTVLTADSTQPLGLVWKVPNYYVSPTTTKGDLIVNNTGTAGGDTRFGVGTDGDIIYYDSLTATGLNTKPYSPLTAKADIYTYNGTSEIAFSAGSDGDIIYYDSLTASGLNTKPYSPLTTEGDLYFFDSDNDRLPKGNHGSFLMVDDNDSPKIKWYDAITVKDYDDNPVGTVIAYGSTNVPAGYLLADGNCYKKTDYEQLFNVIGTSAGECTVTVANDGFNVPDLQNQFLRGLTGGRSVFDSQDDATAVNGLTINNDTHNHSFPFHNTSPDRTGANISATDNATNSTKIVSSDTHNHSMNGDAETRPANVAVVYMIKAEGREPIFGVEKKGLAPNKAGFIIWSAFSTEPEGHRLANGDCILKTDYEDLFENIGTQFGECTISVANDGFNLPDLVTDNRFIRAAGGSITHGSTAQDTTAVNGLSADQDGHRHHDGFGSENVNTYFGFASPSTAFVANNYGPSLFQANYSRAAWTSTTDPVITVSSTEGETAPNNIALTPFIKMYNNDVITGVFEQIEEVIVELDENTANTLSAEVNQSTGAVTNENVDWISSCTDTGTGLVSCDIQGFSVDNANFQCTPERNGGVGNLYSCVVNKIDSDTVQFRNVRSDSGALIDSELFITAHKSGVDYNKLTQNRVIKDSSLEHYNLGDCKFSILDTTQFSTLHTGKWVRMEGQSIAGTDIDNEFGINTLPDAVSNGAFIRQVGGNSGSIRAFQDDQLQNHNHSQRGYSYANNIFGGVGSVTSIGDITQSNIGVPSPQNTDLDTDTSGDTGSFGSETRPKNVALNFYCLVSY